MVVEFSRDGGAFGLASRASRIARVWYRPDYFEDRSSEDFKCRSKKSEAA